MFGLYKDSSLQGIPFYYLVLTKNIMNLYRISKKIIKIELISGVSLIYFKECFLLIENCDQYNLAPFIEGLWDV